MLALHSEYHRGAPQEGEEKEEAALEKKIHSFPAPVQVEVEVEMGDEVAVKKGHPQGVACIVETPGPTALVSSMLERIWGVGVLAGIS